MPIPHEPSTPLAKSKSSRSLIPSPAGNRRDLTYGSSTKSTSRAGYGIVSAAGLNAWRRGPYRGSTSTADSSKRKALGMGLESTPGRKKFKRFSKASKPSIGTQSTPKTAKSRSTLGQAILPGSADRTRLSELSSNLPSSVSSASARAGRDEKYGDSFAVDAAIIVGEDVFGLTVAIDPDGTLHGLSPPSLRPQPDLTPGCVSVTRQHQPSVNHNRGFRWWDDDHDCGCLRCQQYETAEDLVDFADREEETSRLVEVEDVPNDLLEDERVLFERLKYNHLVTEADRDQTIYWESTVAIHDATDAAGDSTIRGQVNTSTHDSESDAQGRTVYWDWTVPIHDASRLSPSHSGDFGAEFTYDNDFLSMLDDFSFVEHSVPLNDMSHMSQHLVDFPSHADTSNLRRRTSREKIASRQQTPRRPIAASAEHLRLLQQYEDDDTSIETVRGLNLSKPATHIDPENMLHEEVHGSRRFGDRSPAQSPLSVSHGPAPLPFPLVTDLDVGVAAPPLSSPLPVVDSDIEVADRIGVVEPAAEPDFMALTVSDVSTDCKPKDPFGFAQAQRAIKRGGVRPRRYRATSEPETPPRTVETCERASSPLTPAPSSVSGTSPTLEPPAFVDRSVVETLASWRGAWRGIQRSSTATIQSGRKLDQRNDGTHVRSSKVFREPMRGGRLNCQKAAQARDARIAHYDDLKANYDLHIKTGYF